MLVHIFTRIFFKSQHGLSELLREVDEMQKENAELRKQKVEARRSPTAGSAIHGSQMPSASATPLPPSTAISDRVLPGPCRAAEDYYY